MRLPWFKRNGIFFLPITIIGWVIFLVCLAYAICVFIDVDSWSHSASDMLMNFALRLLFIWVAYSFIAYIASRKDESE